MKKTFYITTTLPYVNAEAHLGHAMEFIRADVIAREKKIEGYEVFFNTGTDEHGIKVERNAQSLGMKPQEFVDKVSMTFRNLLPQLGISSDAHFIRTTDPKHVAAAQAFWKLCMDRGFLYKKNYKTKYCVGCELEKTDSELVNGKCPLHPLLTIEIIDEENYFFKFSEFQKPLLDLYEKHPDFVVPSFRFNEIKSFVKGGLEDFSVSRLKSKMSWGVPVPGDENHVMYVWFDALVSYISTIGWPTDTASFDKWWIQTGGVVQYCGKDNLRQQSAMWQAMLMAAGLPNSKQVVINGFITGEGGIKMSKSLGNVIDPLDLVKEYGTDAVRYVLLREVSPFEDSPLTLERFKEAYNAHLANGLGNLVSRVMKMAVSNSISITNYDAAHLAKLSDTDLFLKNYKEGFKEFNLKKSMDAIWHMIEWTDRSIQNHQPFKLIKSDDISKVNEAKNLISICLGDLYQIGLMLKPLLPKTSELIMDCIINNKTPEAPLFLRR